MAKKRLISIFCSFSYGKMQSICDLVLAKTGENATVFSVPVDDAVGLRLTENDDE